MKLPLIGVSARLVPGVFAEAGSASVDRTAVVDAVNQLVAAHGGVPLGLPLLREWEGPARAELLRATAAQLDGLLLQGGTDLEPRHYGELPLRPEWAGDPVRDRIELDWVAAFRTANKPILGICRGHQLLNVAYGGSLYQDLPSQLGNQIAHDQAGYCTARHTVALKGWLADCHGVSTALVNSAHHQAVKQLGAGLEALAESPDGIIEALRDPAAKFVVSVQWHPELHAGPALLPATPLLRAFIAACR
jgi:putative glutamine amidotransferase